MQIDTAIASTAAAQSTGRHTVLLIWLAICLAVFVLTLVNDNFSEAVQFMGLYF